MDDGPADITVKRNIDATVVDVDAHYTGRFEDIVAYIDDPVWRDRVEDSIQPSGSVTSKSFWPMITSADELFRKTERGELPEDSEDLSKLMADLQIDKIIFLGNNVITFDQLKGDDKRPTVYANAYVDYVLDQVVDPDNGIYATIPVPYQAPDEAAELIDRVADEKGIVGTCFITSNVEPPLGNRKYDVIYDASERAGLPAIMHGGTIGVDHFYLSGYTYRLETHTLGFVWANMSQLVSIVAHGLPEKFPDLDFVFQEAGLFYVPMMMYRMDAEYFRKPNEAPLLTKRPSEYMKEFYWGTQPLEHVPTKKYFDYVIEMIGGPDRIMYASDYPHPDYDAPTVIEEMPFLSDEDKAKILGKNAEEVFGI